MPKLTDINECERNEAVLDKKGNVLCKHTKEYLESVIERLSTSTPF